MPEAVIEVKNISKSFGRKKVVNNLDMRVEKGEIYGFLGPNGSGKTTFIRMICGLLRPDSGSGRCLDFDVIAESEKIKPYVGYMAQKFSLYEDLTVMENLKFMASVYLVPKKRKSITQVVEQMGLGPFLHQLAGSLSGGWKQRLALGACILHSPSLLLLDEPTAGVDPSARRDFWDMVHELSAEGITSLISTHYMDEAERCHRLAYIAYGDLLAQGSAEEIIASRKLTTWVISGADTHLLSKELKEIPGIEQVVAFGNTLHVSGRESDKLQAALKPYRQKYSCREVRPSLEEAFIDLMRKSGKENA